MIKSFFKSLVENFQRLIDTNHLIKIKHIQQQAECDRIKQEIALKDPDNLALYGGKKYSKQIKMVLLRKYLIERIPRSLLRGGCLYFCAFAAFCIRYLGSLLRGHSLYT